MGNLIVNDGKRPAVGLLVSMQTRGDRIKILRNARKLTLQGMADELVRLGGPPGLTKAAVLKWENGDTENMANSTFILLCKLLHTDPEYILWGDNRSPSTGPDITPPKSARSR